VQGVKKKLKGACAHQYNLKRPICSVGRFLFFSLYPCEKIPVSSSGIPPEVAVHPSHSIYAHGTCMEKFCALNICQKISSLKIN
jgi:hypothetical protein